MRGFLDWLLRGITFFGSLAFAVFIAVLMVFLEDYILALKIAAGTIITIFLAFLIRLVYRKERPTPLKDKSSLLRYLEAQSFPSVHAARAGCFSVLVYPAFPKLLFFLIIAVVLVSISRIIMRKHYAADVFAGLVLGFLSGIFVEFIFSSFFS
jgi:membrane-associated phospholipid phosphatase